MNILVACEESQRVCIEFRKKGHNAFSCDIIDESGGHPEWHIKGDVLNILEPYGAAEICFTTQDNKKHEIDKWDMILAFPPCTHLAVSGAAWFEAKRADGRQREGIEFFCKFLNLSCPKVVIENPVGIISGYYVFEYFIDLARQYGLPRKPTQIINPWQFGDKANKKTCLWIKGLPPLTPEVTEKPELEYKEWIDDTGKIKRMERWFAEAWNLKPEERAKVRSKTFPGVARAMAEQWG